MKTEANEPIGISELKLLEIEKGKQYIQTPFSPGLTKREYFAAIALSGFKLEVQPDQHIEKMARFAVYYADALIKALNEGE